MRLYSHRAYLESTLEALAAWVARERAREQHASETRDEALRRELRETLRRAQRVPSVNFPPSRIS